ncbi:BEM_collapsed_G0021830.mRNA.1.CDS.1 [Saccharomyces cerevisiae]|nr:BEM_collapsed_G0021830.mRNA.1.CDS.1 [Saccharomyces cerevisiae]
MATKNQKAERVTSFEMDFVKMLLCYLNFNNFDKLSIELSPVLNQKKVLLQYCALCRQLFARGLSELIYD